MVRIPAVVVTLSSMFALLGGCSGTTVPYTFEGEPVCPDFAIGDAEPVRGGLKRPLHVTFKDGDDVVAQVILVGLRTPDSPETPILLPDTDAEYDVQWGACENERAPAPTAIKGSPADMKYECGAHEPYATTKVATTKGNPTRKITVTPPAEAACWTGSTAPAGSAPAESASAPPPPPPVPELSASASASAGPSASAAPSAPAAPSGPAAPSAPAPSGPAAPGPAAAPTPASPLVPAATPSGPPAGSPPPPPAGTPR